MFSQNVNNSFDLSEYLRKLLESNPSPQALRQIIKNDIQSTKSELSQQLLKLGCDEQQLNISYNHLVKLQTQIKSIEAQINRFIESDLIDSQRVQFCL